MYISGGENVFPGEVEAAHADCPGVAEVVVVGVPDERWGEVGRAFVQPRAGATVGAADVVAHARGRLAGVFLTFGRVPMFYYLLHVPLIHATALLVGFIREGVVHPEWYATAPYAQVPEESRWSLPLLYLVFAIDVAISTRCAAGSRGSSRGRGRAGCGTYERVVAVGTGSHRTLGARGAGRR
jgi:hypothetical protein